jgi:dihydropteroate synthase
VDAGAAIRHAKALIAEGAEIIDIGGESTRPRALAVSLKEELRRVMPVIEGLAGEVSVPISIDTVKPEVAHAALAAGAAIVNDVAANRSEPAMWETVAAAGAGYICVHMQGTPPTMQTEPQYVDVVSEVMGFFRDRLERLRACGVSHEQVVLDPGIGFGKNLDHNLQLLGALGTLVGLGQPLCLGVSRKSFISRLLGLDLQHRLAPGLACACLAVEAGVHMLRVHDVVDTVNAVRMTEAIVAKRSVTC